MLNQSLILSQLLSLSLLLLLTNLKVVNAAETKATSESPTATEPAVKANLTVKDIPSGYLSRPSYGLMLNTHCSLSILKAFPRAEDEAKKDCTLLIYTNGYLPHWVHPTLLHDVKFVIEQATDEERLKFTDMICPCRNLDVSKTCPGEVIAMLAHLIAPCYAEHESDDLKKRLALSIKGNLESDTESTKQLMEEFVEGFSSSKNSDSVQWIFDHIKKSLKEDPEEASLYTWKEEDWDSKPVVSFEEMGSQYDEEYSAGNGENY